MKLWLLQRPTVEVADGELACIKIPAGTDIQAREMAAMSAGPEGKDVWLDETRSTCVEVQPDDGA